MPIPFFLLFAVMGGITALAVKKERDRKRRLPNTQPLPPPGGDVGFLGWGDEWWALTFKDQRDRVTYEGPRKLSARRAYAWWAAREQSTPPFVTVGRIVWRGGRWEIADSAEGYF